MKHRTLGKTGLQVSEIGFGGWAIGGNSYGPTDDRVSLRAVKFAFDHGITFFDTADIYGEGRSEQLIGEALKGKRDKVFIATKAGWDFYHGGTKKAFDAEYIRFAVCESLKRLKTDYIDVYQMHNPSLEQLKEGRFYAVLDELVKEGKIRTYGISIHTVDDGEAVLASGRAAVIQLILNIMDQRPMPELLPRAKDAGVGIIAREPLNCGMLTGKYGAGHEFKKGDHRRRWKPEKMAQDLKKLEEIKQIIKDTKVSLAQAALEFVLAQNGVSVVIPGAKTEDHVREHIRASESPALSESQLQALEALSREELFQSGFYHN
ncbi:MAG: aldo/keto reductase [Candidatus Omnitrophica bacterium]|nr:aldo/keto reductase [Candidatus Omnitrophota bacterium]